MAITVRELLIELATKVDDKELLELDRKLDDDLPKSAKKAGKGLDGFFSVVKKGGAIVAGATVALIGFALETSKNFETLKTSLKTVTGSAEAADKAFEFITEFAAKTPFQVTEIADAFIKLTALGLEPSEAALESYGNTASAMGKSLDQFIEAVADATTGEFERLKEFGIKTRVEGDRIKLTFQGVTTNIGNNAEEIQEFLQGIGQVQFAGAMADQMNTLAGVFSNIQDNVALFLFQLGEEGLLDAAKEVAGQIRDLTGDSDQFAKTIGPALAKIIVGLGKLIPLLVEVIDETAFLINHFDEISDTVNDDFGPAIDLLKTNFELLILPITAILDVLGKVSSVVGDGISELSEMEGILGEIARQIISIGTNFGLISGPETVSKRGLTGVEQVQVSGTGGAGATAARTEARNININRSSSDLLRIANDQNVSAANRGRAAVFAAAAGQREQLAIAATVEALGNVQRFAEGLKKPKRRGGGGGRGGRRRKPKETQLTDAELLTIINEAGATGQSLDDLVGGRKLPSGPPPVITIQTTKNEFKINAPMDIDVNAVPGTTAVEVAALVAERVPAEIRIAVEEAIEIAQPSRKR